MKEFAEALAAVRALKDEGVIRDYAVGGAMALIFWTEPIATFDLDVFVVLHSDGILISLDPIYRWAKARGYPIEKEHIMIAGVPVQVIPTPNALANEAVANAADLDYDGQPVRVIRPEYLVAMYLEPAARTYTRLARAGALLDSGVVDGSLLDDVIKRYNLELPKQ